MSKGLTFTNSEHDRKLIRDIEKYQHKNEIQSFVEAVRQLCEMALKVEKLTEKKD